MTSHWPLFDLRVRTERLELRIPTPGDLEALANFAADGVHDPDQMPFTTPWTDVEPEARARSVLQWAWRQWGALQPQDWNMDFAVLLDGRVVGTQGIGARQFAVLREVRTGSWLGRRHQGRGVGTEMRAAVLHLAFEGLGARHACSSAFEDNDASLGVSRKLGYLDDGLEWHARRGAPAATLRLRVDRERWAAHRSVDVRFEGLEPCLPFLGVDQ